MNGSAEAGSGAGRHRGVAGGAWDLRRPVYAPHGSDRPPPPHPPPIFGLSYRLFGLTLLAGVGAWVAFPSLTIPQRWAILIPLLTFPLIHYAVAYMPRYREPVDWILFLLAEAAVWRARGKVARAPSAERPPGK